MSKNSKKEKNVFYSNGKKYYKKMVQGKVLTAKTQEELNEKVDNYKKLLKIGQKELCDMTMQEYIFRWYEKKEKEVQHCTITTYKYAAFEVIKRIGKQKLLDVTPAMLQDCVSDFASTKSKFTNHYPSQKYIDNMVKVLRMVFDRAVDELIFPSNYAKNISAKTKTTRTGMGHRALDEDEIKNIINFDHKTRPYVLFMLTCGLMPEETVPLTWGDIISDEEGNFFVCVNKTAELNSAKPSVIRENKAKNKYRIRTVKIPYPLDEWVKERKAKHKNTELIFTNNSGKLLSASALQSRWNTYLVDLDIFVNHKPNKFSPKRTDADRKLDIKKFTQYDLRHTYATQLASIGVPVRATTAMMGHSMSTTTDKYYIDFNKIDTNPDAEKLGEKFKRIAKND